MMKFFRKNRDLCLSRHLLARKSLSFQLSWWPEHSSDLFLRFVATTKGDHAGLDFSWQVGFLMFDVNLYDERHWNDERDCWQSS